MKSLYDNKGTNIENMKIIHDHRRNFNPRRNFPLKFKVFQANFLKQRVSKPTLVNDILDLVLCHDENKVGNIQVGGKLDNIDHEEI